MTTMTTGTSAEPEVALTRPRPRVWHLVDAGVIAGLLAAGWVTVTDMYAAFVLQLLATSLLTILALARAARRVRRRAPHRSLPPAGTLVRGGDLDVDALAMGSVQQGWPGDARPLVWGGMALQYLADRALRRALLAGLPTLVVLGSGAQALRGVGGGLSAGALLLVVRALAVGWDHQRAALAELTTSTRMGRLFAAHVSTPSRQLWRAALVAAAFAVVARVLPAPWEVVAATVAVVLLHLDGLALPVRARPPHPHLSSVLYATPGYYPAWLSSLLSGELPSDTPLERADPTVLVYFDGAQLTDAGPHRPPADPAATRQPDTPWHGPPQPDGRDPACSAPVGQARRQLRAARFQGLALVGVTGATLGVPSFVLLVLLLVPATPPPELTEHQIAAYDQPVQLMTLAERRGSLDTPAGTTLHYRRSEPPTLYTIDGDRHFFLSRTPEDGTPDTWTVCARQDAPEQHLVVPSAHRCGDSQLDIGGTRLWEETAREVIAPERSP